MPKKKTKKTTSRKVSPRSTSKGFFEEHKNLKWLLPLLVLALLGLFLVYNHVQEELSEEVYSTKQQIKETIKMDKVTPSPTYEDSTTF